MASAPVELRLNFLKEAARTLAVPSPAVSASIGAAHDNLLVAENRDIETSRKDWEALRRDVCGYIGPKMRMKDDESAQTVSTKPLAEEHSKISKSANATSKQRKKARKGGLQAMLDKNKTTNSAPGLGLDFMDFMQ
ncbi:hypothetical protein K458DRAFT_287683 [Lentithecium fluviatile CBS 122367]|uniref:Uncharacterized protein n=1 Tax=Lentithecium fluviatile CBS 122367 TaxID=1168545 RepID=A0A6G1JL68_9PLEO|nr:hypothetical protein K458DRAFT_287683 [Lentithecium fluviatile CBS 122367]